MKIERDGTKVKIVVETDLPYDAATSRVLMHFAYECGDYAYAELLCRHLRRQFNEEAARHGAGERHSIYALAVRDRSIAALRGQVTKLKKRLENKP